MSSLKINQERLALILSLVFSNFWIYRIFKLDFITGIIVVFTTLITSLFWDKKNLFKVTLVCMLILLLFQYKTTEQRSLTLLDNDEQRVQQERMRSYPPAYINLFFKTIWLKPESRIEENPLVIGLSRIEASLLENLSLNRYFFGGFPRNNPDDFEKFTFLLVPAFIAGTYKIIKDKKYKILVLLLITPLTVLSVIGNKNSPGPFVLFPFFIISFAAGIKLLGDYFKNRRVFYICFITLIVLGFILQISYARI